MNTQPGIKIKFTKRMSEEVNDIKHKQKQKTANETQFWIRKQRRRRKKK